MVLQNCIWIIGNVNQVNFWLDNWMGETIASKFNVHDKFHKNLTSMVSDWWTTQGCSINDNIQMTLPNLLNTISTIVIPDFNVEDTLVWKSSTNGDLSFMTAYNIIIKPPHSKFWSTFPWDKDSPPK